MLHYYSDSVTHILPAPNLCLHLLHLFKHTLCHVQPQNKFSRRVAGWYRVKCFKWPKLTQFDFFPPCLIRQDTLKGLTQGCLEIV